MSFAAINPKISIMINTYASYKWAGFWALDTQPRAMLRWCKHKRVDLPGIDYKKIPRTFNKNSSWYI